MALLSKRSIVIALVIVAIPILAFAWWLLSPLFLDTTVSEEFPMSSTAEMPSGVTQEEAEEIMEGMAKINMGVDEPMPEPMVDAAIVSSGQFRDGDSFHKGSGDAKVYRLPNGDTVLRIERLNVTNGPELHVLVTPHPDPPGRAELQDAGYVDLGKLKGNRGDQNYDIPDDTDPDSIGSVVIYCLPFRVIFSVAALDDQN